MAKESFLKRIKFFAEKFTRALYKAQQWVDPHKDTNLIQNIEFANIANAFSSGTGEFVRSLNRLQVYSKRRKRLYRRFVRK